MDYEKMWNSLKEKLQDMANQPLTNSRNLVKDVEDIAKKQTYYQVLTLIGSIEENNKNTDDDKYKL